MNQKTVYVVAGACVLVGLGIFFGVTARQKTTHTDVDAGMVKAQSEQVASTTIESDETSLSKATPSVNIKTYTNAAFGYSFSYPNNWTMEPETSVKDAQNDMPSIVSVHETKTISPKRFSVTVNRNERTLKNQTSKTQAITVAGQQVTAYLFPEGLNCKPTDADSDCSFFIIPIQHGGVWYEINVANEATTLDAYRTLLASFKFTK